MKLNILSTGDIHFLKDTERSKVKKQKKIDTVNINEKESYLNVR